VIDECPSGLEIDLNFIQSELDNLKPEVKLKGPSLKMLMKDTLGKKVNIDSLFNRTDIEE
jgi:hypothetical protein